MNGQQTKNGEKYMEPNSQVKILEAQIRECFGRVVWTHKIQEKCADILNFWNTFIKMAQIILSALTTSGILITVFGENKIVGVISVLISTALLALNTYIKNYDLGSAAEKHANAASLLWDVRENYLSLLTDIKAVIITEKEIVEKRDNLQKELHNIYKGAPRSISRAYKKASLALKENEELTFSDKEINAFLPKELRKNS